MHQRRVLHDGVRYKFTGLLYVWLTLPRETIDHVAILHVRLNDVPANIKHTDFRHL